MFFKNLAILLVFRCSNRHSGEKTIEVVSLPSGTPGRLRLTPCLIICGLRQAVAIPLAIAAHCRLVLTISGVPATVAAARLQTTISFVN